MAKSQSVAGQKGDLSKKRKYSSQLEPERPRKKTKTLLEADASDEESVTSSSFGGVSVGKHGRNESSGVFTVNQEFAQRFEHNKKREELHRCRFRFTSV